ncbi:hypothetical protein [Streptomyces sp. G45]|uniref:hypothetical protein n=1 Tax=Streptomyces sp. G45 TaxID=3406627 RepID=UPI003C2151C7
MRDGLRAAGPGAGPGSGAEFGPGSGSGADVDAWPQGRDPRRRKVGALGWSLLVLLLVALFTLWPR